MPRRNAVCQYSSCYWDSSLFVLLELFGLLELGVVGLCGTYFNHQINLKG